MLSEPKVHAPGLKTPATWRKTSYCWSEKIKSSLQDVMIKFLLPGSMAGAAGLLTSDFYACLELCGLPIST